MSESSEVRLDILDELDDAGMTLNATKAVAHFEFIDYNQDV